jgi:hypothetical protein
VRDIVLCELGIVISTCLQSLSRGIVRSNERFNSCKVKTFEARDANAVERLASRIVCALAKRFLAYLRGTRPRRTHRSR